MIEAHNVLRYVPLVYLISPSTGKQIGVAVHKGLVAADAQDLATRSLEDEFSDNPLDILHEMRLVHLIEHAQDWRFMTPPEIEMFKTQLPPFYEGQYEGSEEAQDD